MLNAGISQNYINDNGTLYPEENWLLAQGLKAQGFVPKAFYKDGIGDIDLVWGKGGKKGYGLAHILDQRKEDGLDEIKFVRNLPRIIKDGTIEKIPNQPNIIFIKNKDDSALIKMIWDDKSRKWVLTSFREK